MVIREEGQARHAGERSTSRKCYRGSTGGTSTLPLKALITSKQLEPLWRSLASGIEKVADQSEGRQLMQGGGKEDRDESCYYYGRGPEDSAGESEANNVQVPIPHAHGGLGHTRCRRYHAKHLTRGHADPRPCVACRSACPGENRPPHQAALVGGLPMAGHGQNVGGGEERVAVHPPLSARHSRTGASQLYNDRCLQNV